MFDVFPLGNDGSKSTDCARHVRKHSLAGACAVGILSALANHQASNPNSQNSNPLKLNKPNGELQSLNPGILPATSNPILLFALRLPPKTNPKPQALKPPKPEQTQKARHIELLICVWKYSNPSSEGFALRVPAFRVGFRGFGLRA